MRQASRRLAAGADWARPSPQERRQADLFFDDLLGVSSQAGRMRPSALEEAEWENDAWAV